MKKIAILLLLIFAIAKINAQNYFINFAANGAITIIDSVKVDNITQATSLKLPGTDTLHLTGTQGIHNSDIDNENIQVFPNPMQGQTEISFYANQAGNALLAIYDVSGKVVLEINNEFSQGIQIYRIAGLRQGIYFISISGENYFYTAKLLSITSFQTDVKIEYLGSDKSETMISKLKSAKAIINMAYTAGDTLHFTAYSGAFTDIVRDVPDSSKTIIFTFFNTVANCATTAINCGTISDIDGNIYNTVIIGSQCWMRENLKTSKYRNNTNITYVTDDVIWEPLTTEAWCYYANDTSNNGVYGKLYNWYAVNDSNGLCPAGWHVPSVSDWTTLTNYLGGAITAGSKLKEADTIHWLSPNQGATNQTCFTALPGGYRNPYGNFNGLTWGGYWWTSTEDGSWAAHNRLIYFDYTNVYSDGNHKEAGLSVRCLRD